MAECIPLPYLFPVTVSLTPLTAFVAACPVPLPMLARPRPTSFPNSLVTLNHLPTPHARTERLSAFPDLFASAGIGPFDVCSRRVKLSFGSGACHPQSCESLQAQEAIYRKITLLLKISHCRLRFWPIDSIHAAWVIALAFQCVLCLKNKQGGAGQRNVCD
jgi:hypothetical protein